MSQQEGKPRIVVGQITPGYVLNLSASGPTEPRRVTPEMRADFKKRLSDRIKPKRS